MSGKKSNRDRETPDQNRHLKEPAVLTAFKTCARVTRASKMAGISRDTFYRWLRADAACKKVTRTRASRQIDSLEDEVVRRAHEGIEKLITVAGQLEVIREYSDTLFLLDEIVPTRAQLVGLRMVLARRTEEKISRMSPCEQCERLERHARQRQLSRFCSLRSSGR